jgi:hypothetical protein
MDRYNIASNIYLPRFLNSWETLVQCKDDGRFQFKLDKSHLPPGTVLGISFQERLHPDQPFFEFNAIYIMVPVSIPPPPAYGNRPIETYEFRVLFGLQIQAQVVRGDLPEKGLFWALNKID